MRMQVDPLVKLGQCKAFPASAAKAAALAALAALAEARARPPLPADLGPPRQRARGRALRLLRAAARHGGSPLAARHGAVARLRGSGSAAARLGSARRWLRARRECARRGRRIHERARALNWP